MCQEIYTFIYSMKCSLSVYYILGTEKAKDISMQLPSSENLWRIKREGVAMLSAVTRSGHLNPGRCSPLKTNLDHHRKKCVGIRRARTKIGGDSVEEGPGKTDL